LLHVYIQSFCVRNQTIKSDAGFLELFLNFEKFAKNSKALKKEKNLKEKIVFKKFLQGRQIFALISSAGARNDAFLSDKNFSALWNLSF